MGQTISQKEFKVNVKNFKNEEKSLIDFTTSGEEKSINLYFWGVIFSAIIFFILLIVFIVK